MSLPTPSTSVSHRRFHQCVNHENKLDLRHPLPSFGSFGFFQASIWLKNKQTLVKLSSDIYFDVVSWFPRNAHCTVSAGPAVSTTFTKYVGGVCQIQSCFSAVQRFKVCVHMYMKTDQNSIKLWQNDSQFSAKKSDFKPFGSLWISAMVFTFSIASWVWIYW